MIRIAQPIIGPEEEEAVLATLRSGQLVQGPRVAAFEGAFARYVGVRQAVAVSSGTAALVLALQAHGIAENDEVIVPAFTFAATANAVLLVGARPIIVDIRSDDFTIDSAQLKMAITPRTRAVIAVHLYGHPCDMTALVELARRHSLIVIEDAAQSAGATWQGQQVGSFGTGCFSFYATKNMTTGEGGMITTNDDELARRARILRSQGEEERYRTDILAGNQRMTEIEAAMGLVQLARLDAWNEQRRANAAWLTAHIRGVITPVEQAGARHAYHLYTVRVPNECRDALLDSLRQRGVEAGIYYPLCIHQHPLYQQLGIGGSFPIAERAVRDVLSLPVHPALSHADLETVASTLNESLAGAEVSRG